MATSPPSIPAQEWNISEQGKPAFSSDMRTSDVLQLLLSHQPIIFIIECISEQLLFSLLGKHFVLKNVDGPKEGKSLVLIDLRAKGQAMKSGTVNEQALGTGNIPHKSKRDSRATTLSAMESGSRQGGMATHS